MSCAILYNLLVAPLLVLRPDWVWTPFLDLEPRQESLIQVEEVVGWLPADSETLTVASSFGFPQPVNRSDEIPPITFADHRRLALLQGLERSVSVDPLVGKAVRLAVQGERNFDVVTSFGGLRREACSILLFENDQEAAWREIETSIRSKLKRTRKIGNRDVFELSSTTIMESAFTPKEWQGLFVTKVEPNTIILATSDRYLEELLARRNERPAERAFPKSLSEWNSVDRSAPIWMIRHIPEKLPRTFFSGLTWSWKQDLFRAEFLGTTDRSKKIISSIWTPPDFADTTLQPRISAKNGRIFVTVETQKLQRITPDFFWFALRVDGTHGEDGTLYGGEQYIPPEYKEE